MSTSPATGGRWTAADMPDQTGRTAVVTGANSGLGFETCRALAARNATVIMAVRDLGKGRAALASLRTQGSGRLEVARLDLADLDSVRAFANGLIERGKPLDLLVNNAGIGMPPRTLTAQGFESQFGVNHLGHFALTGLLLPLLRRGSGARVVTVGSGAFRGGSIHFDDLHGERSYRPAARYRQSKLANVLFGLELDRRLRTDGMPVASLLAHPGLALRLGNKLVAQPAERGAWSQLYAATARDVEGGQFFGPGGRTGMRGHPILLEPGPRATDPETARRLWAVSTELTGVGYEFSDARLT
ncbi:oxidoreductase [Amycolatopsis nigrescens]|uniref:oxidoreductase n=1 Tax=Amycolatopsis nigrescens TaxID=381445 RepID=UPI0003A1DA54|nr:oxidoreductase [Amycolatopsis nigrescens]